jgi:hypothetical protein
MPTQFPYVTDSIRGDVPINFYPAADSEKGVILHGTPGLEELCTLTDCTEVRGLFSRGAYLYAVAVRGGESVFWRIDSTGGFAEVGTITTSNSGPVWIEENQTQILIVDGVSGWVFTPTTNHFVQITDAAFPGASSCTAQDGYGLFTVPDSNQWFFSAPQDFLSFDAGDFYSAEGKTGDVVNILSDHREPWIFCEKFYEVWYNAGGDNTSPTNPTFARNQGGLGEFGCAAPKSAASFDNSVAWLSNHGQILRANGYNAQVISTDMMGREISQYATISDAISFSYTENEHTFFQITFPTAGKTWVLDAKTKLWHKRQSFTGGGEFGRHRANCHAYLDSTNYVGDYTNGKIYKMSMNYLDEDGEEIQRQVMSSEFVSGMSRTFYPSVQIEFEPGVGLESGLDPQAMLQYSDDGGKTWSSELWRSAGKIGEYSRRAVWNRMGSSFRRIYKLTVSDPVVWKILSISWWGQK